MGSGSAPIRWQISPKANRRHVVAWPASNVDIARIKAAGAHPRSVGALIAQLLRHSGHPQAFNGCAGLSRSWPASAIWSITSVPTGSSGDSSGSGEATGESTCPVGSARSPTCCRTRHWVEAPATRWRSLDTLLSAARLEDLVGAVERLDNGAAIKRLGYLLEVLGHDTAALVRPLTSGFPALDPSLPVGSSRSARRGLRINADVSV